MRGYVVSIFLFFFTPFAFGQEKSEYKNEAIQKLEAKGAKVQSLGEVESSIRGTKSTVNLSRATATSKSVSVTSDIAALFTANSAGKGTPLVVQNVGADASTFVLTKNNIIDRVDEFTEKINLWMARLDELNRAYNNTRLAYRRADAFVQSVSDGETPGQIARNFTSFIAASANSVDGVSRTNEAFGDRLVKTPYYDTTSVNGKNVVTEKYTYNKINKSTPLNNSKGFQSAYGLLMRANTAGHLVIDGQELVDDFNRDIQTLESIGNLPTGEAISSALSFGIGKLRDIKTITTDITQTRKYCEENIKECIESSAPSASCNKIQEKCDKMLTELTALSEKRENVFNSIEASISEGKTEEPFLNKEEKEKAGRQVQAVLNTFFIVETNGIFEGFFGYISPFLGFGSGRAGTVSARLGGGDNVLKSIFSYLLLGFIVFLFLLDYYYRNVNIVVLSEVRESRFFSIGVFIAFVRVMIFTVLAIPIVISLVALGFQSLGKISGVSTKVSALIEEAYENDSYDYYNDKYKEVAPEVNTLRFYKNWVQKTTTNSLPEATRLYSFTTPISSFGDNDVQGLYNIVKKEVDGDIITLSELPAKKEDRLKYVYDIFLEKKENLKETLLKIEAQADNLADRNSGNYNKILTVKMRELTDDVRKAIKDVENAELVVKDAFTESHTLGDLA